MPRREVGFDGLFDDRDDDNPEVKFYSARRKFYDNHYGHSDVLFAAVEYLDKQLDKVPIFDRARVNEFQDFSKLEVSLHRPPGVEKSDLLAGDDDQALYDLKKTGESAASSHRLGARPQGLQMIRPGDFPRRVK